MRVPPKFNRRGVVVAAVSLCAIFGAFAASATAAKETIITFTEPSKGSVFSFIDNPPKTKPDKHGNPLKISAGDGLTVWNPLVSGGKKIGHLQAFCFATKSARNFAAAAFECTGTWVFPTGTLAAQAVLGKTGTEGSILGGTGIYANARGTFISEEGKTPTRTTITLIE